MPLEPRASWFSPKCVEAQQLTGHLGGSRSASETMGDKLHRREGNSPDHQLRPLNDRSVIKEVGVQRQPGGERSALGGSTRVSGSRRSGSENVGLSNANIGENPMPRKPKGSSARVRRGRENAPSQCSSTRRYGAEVTHAILPGKARTTFNKRCRKVKEVGDLMTGEPATEAPVNGGRNYNGPKVAKFLVGAHIDGKVWHLDVGSSPPGAVVCSKGWAVRPLKRYVSWVQNVVRQFGPYPVWALEH
ncbi:hypothetical protein PVK06_040667 [Gossypium arboreum]|uniref:Uncharacterized protein n=1 Tax=Gossypium arboreum TaxID=29729 RepID=A0ABR0N652_GOSAR|nr:hypothetical protein PVK06_040667 [Gossypium arboreum]